VGVILSEALKDPPVCRGSRRWIVYPSTAAVRFSPEGRALSHACLNVILSEAKDPRLRASPRRNGSLSSQPPPERRGVHSRGRAIRAALPSVESNSNTAWRPGQVANRTPVRTPASGPAMWMARRLGHARSLG